MNYCRGIGTYWRFFDKGVKYRLECSVEHDFDSKSEQPVYRHKYVLPPELKGSFD